MKQRTRTIYSKKQKALPSAMASISQNWGIQQHNSNETGVPISD